MTSQTLRPLPPHLQPHAKSSSTLKSTQLAVPANTSPASSRSSSQTRPSQTRKTARNEDYASEKATVSLIRRVLCPASSHADQKGFQRSIDELLPPLTSSNDVDLQLYAIIAIIIKDFVYAWYSKITPDQTFVDEVVQIIAHCTRALEQRLRRIDVQELVLDEIPAICVGHFQGTFAKIDEAYKISHHSQQSNHPSPPREVYHTLNPHPGLSPVPEAPDSVAAEQQSNNERVYRQLLVEGTLAVLLPTEDLENSCLRTLVGDIIGDLILGQTVSGKVCESWFIWQVTAKICEIIRARVQPKTDGEEIELDTRSRLEKFGLLTAKDENKQNHSPPKHQSRLTALFWKTLQYGYFAFIFARFLFVGLWQARTAAPRSYPTRSKSSPSSPTSATHALSNLPAASISPMPPQPRRAILEYRTFTLISEILDLSTRMPWLSGFLSFCQHVVMDGTGRAGQTDRLLDR
ncbi:MAG: hypothetical protein Q9227_004100 [Pyrenula ochraceoflavens]